MQTEDEDRVLTSAEVEKILDLKPRTLDQWRVYGKGPRFTKIGRNVRYRRSEVRAYLAANTFASTTEADRAA